MRRSNAWLLVFFACFRLCVYVSVWMSMCMSMYVCGK
jgi:hypothetical protein